MDFKSEMREVLSKLCEEASKDCGENPYYEDLEKALSSLLVLIEKKLPTEDRLFDIVEDLIDCRKEHYLGRNDYEEIVYPSYSLKRVIAQKCLSEIKKRMGI